MAASENVKAKSLDSPEETRTFEHGKLEIATIDEFSAGRVTLEPGWRWSEAVKPLAQTPSCQVQHTGYLISGQQMHLVHDDGTEQHNSSGRHVRASSRA
jgi:hypothetical protein